MVAREDDVEVPVVVEIPDVDQPHGAVRGDVGVHSAVLEATVYQVQEA